MKKSFVGSRVIYRGTEISLRERRGTVISENMSGVQVVMDTSQVGRGLIVSVNEEDLILDEFEFHTTEEFSEFLTAQFRKSRPIIPIHSKVVITPQGPISMSAMSRKNESGGYNIVFVTDSDISELRDVAILEVESAVEFMFGKLVSRPVLKSLMVSSAYEPSDDQLDLDLF
jgi:hypothetical protein